MDYHSMKRRQLQALCKKHNIPANSANSVLADKLSQFLNDKLKPKARQRTCIKSSVEKTDEHKPALSKRQAKKVRFSPNNDLLEYEPEKKHMAMVANTKVQRNSVAKKVDKSVVGDINTVELIEDVPVKLTRSRVQGKRAIKDVEMGHDGVKGNGGKLGRVTRSKAHTLDEGVVDEYKPRKRVVKNVENANELVDGTVVDRVRVTWSKAETKRSGKQVAKDKRTVEQSKEIIDIPVRVMRTRGQTSNEDIRCTVNDPSNGKKRTRRQMKLTDTSKNLSNIAPEDDQKLLKRKSMSIRGVKNMDEDETDEVEVVNETRVARLKSHLAKKSSTRSNKSKTENKVAEPSRHTGKKNVTRRKSVVQVVKIESVPRFEEPVKRRTRQSVVLEESKVQSDEVKENVTRSRKNASENEREAVSNASRSRKSMKQRGPAVIEDQTVEAEFDSPVDESPNGSVRSAEGNMIAGKQMESSLKTTASRKNAATRGNSSNKRSKLSGTKHSDLMDDTVKSNKVGCLVSEIGDFELDEKVIEAEVTPAVDESRRRFTRSAIRSERKEPSESAINEQYQLSPLEVAKIRAHPGFSTAPGRITRSGIKIGRNSASTSAKRINKNKHATWSAHQRERFDDDAQISSPDVTVARSEIRPNPDVTIEPQSDRVKENVTRSRKNASENERKSVSNASGSLKSRKRRGTVVIEDHTVEAELISPVDESTNVSVRSVEGNILAGKQMESSLKTPVTRRNAAARDNSSKRSKLSGTKQSDLMNPTVKSRKDGFPVSEIGKLELGEKVIEPEVTRAVDESHRRFTRSAIRSERKESEYQLSPHEVAKIRADPVFITAQEVTPAVPESRRRFTRSAIRSQRQEPSESAIKEQYQLSPHEVSKIRADPVFSTASGQITRSGIKVGRNPASNFAEKIDNNKQASRSAHQRERFDDDAQISSPEVAEVRHTPDEFESRSEFRHNPDVTLEPPSVRSHPDVIVTSSEISQSPDVTTEPQSEIRPNPVVPIEFQSEIRPNLDLAVESQFDIRPDPDLAVGSQFEFRPNADVTVESETEFRPNPDVIVESQSDIRPNPDISVVSQPEIGPDLDVAVESQSEIQPNPDVTAVSHFEISHNLELPTGIQSEFKPTPDVPVEIQSKLSEETTVHILEKSADFSALESARLSIEDIRPDPDIYVESQPEIRPNLDVAVESQFEIQPNPDVTAVSHSKISRSLDLPTGIQAEFKPTPDVLIEIQSELSDETSFPILEKSANLSALEPASLLTDDIRPNPDISVESQPETRPNLDVAVESQSEIQPKPDVTAVSHSEISHKLDLPTGIQSEFKPTPDVPLEIQSELSEERTVHVLEKSADLSALEPAPEDIKENRDSGTLTAAVMETVSPLSGENRDSHDMFNWSIATVKDFGESPSGEGSFNVSTPFLMAETVRVATSDGFTMLNQNVDVKSSLSSEAEVRVAVNIQKSVLISGSPEGDKSMRVDNSLEDEENKRDSIPYNVDSSAALYLSFEQSDVKSKTNEMEVPGENDIKDGIHVIPVLEKSDGEADHRKEYVKEHVFEVMQSTGDNANKIPISGNSDDDDEKRETISTARFVLEDPVLSGEVDVREVDSLVGEYVAEPKNDDSPDQSAGDDKFFQCLAVHEHDIEYDRESNVKSLTGDNAEEDEVSPDQHENMPVLTEILVHSDLSMSKEGPQHLLTSGNDNAEITCDAREEFLLDINKDVFISDGLENTTIFTCTKSYSGHEKKITGVQSKESGSVSPDIHHESSDKEEQKVAIVDREWDSGKLVEGDTNLAVDIENPTREEYSPKEDDINKQEENRNTSTYVDWGDYGLQVDEYQKPVSAHESDDALCESEKDDRVSDIHSVRNADEDSKNVANEKSNQEEDLLDRHANADVREAIFSWPDSSLKSSFTPATSRIRHLKDGQDDAGSSLKTLFATPAPTQISHLKDDETDAVRFAFSVDRCIEDIKTKGSLTHEFSNQLEIESSKDFNRENEMYEDSDFDDYSRKYFEEEGGTSDMSAKNKHFESEGDKQADKFKQYDLSSRAAGTSHDLKDYTIHSGEFEKKEETQLQDDYGPGFDKAM